jgi:hypothetical protein
MRMYALAIVAAPVPAFSQSIEIGPGGVHIDRGRDREGRGCEELRRACLYKEELGEEGRAIAVDTARRAKSRIRKRSGKTRH